MAEDKEGKDKDKKARVVAKTLDDLKKFIKKEHGDGAIMQGRNAIVAVDSFPTGVATIDKALGCGGLPEGRIMEIFGFESCGKTTTCLHLIGACQRHNFTRKGRKGVAAFIDAEHAFDPVWAEKCGVDVENLLFCQPDSGEEAFDILERMVESGQIDLVVVDSIASMVPQKVLEGDVGDANIGAQARLMSQGLTKIKGKANKSKTTVIFINQIRQKIGVMFGDPNTTPGGLAMKFYASIRAQINKGSAIKEGDTVVAFRPTIKFIKNKCAPPFTSAEYEICVGNPKRPVCGIDEVSALIEVASEMGIITKKSSYYVFEGETLGNGLSAASAVIRGVPDTQKQLREKIYEKLIRQPVAVSADTDTSPDEDELGDDILDDDNPK